MTFVLTLIASSGAAIDLDRAVATLRRQGVTAGAPDWLSQGAAVDIPFAGAAPEPVAALLRGPGVDAAAQPVAHRRKRLLVADMESTIIENEMLDDLAAMAGIGARIAEITRRAMNGEIGFEGALRERVGLLGGLPAALLDRAADGIRVMPGAAELVATMRAHGATCALVSGGFRFFTGLVRTRLGFDLDQANDLLLEDGKLAGRVREPILGRQAKLEALERLAAERGLSLAETMAVGDGANDLAMLKAAGTGGVAFHAKPVVAAEAATRIDHADLTALLYLQGYRDSEIVRSPAR
jgi:phosphoserine phosphatase